MIDGFRIVNLNLHKLCMFLSFSLSVNFCWLYHDLLSTVSLFFLCHLLYSWSLLLLIFQTFLLVNIISVSLITWVMSLKHLKKAVSCLASVLLPPGFQLFQMEVRFKPTNYLLIGQNKCWYHLLEPISYIHRILASFERLEWFFFFFLIKGVSIGYSNAYHVISLLERF